MSVVSASIVVNAPLAKVAEYLIQVRSWQESFSSSFELEVMAEDGRLIKGEEYSCLVTRYRWIHRCLIRVEDLRPDSIVLKQKEGLFNKWILREKLVSEGESHTLIEDRLEYDVPYSLFGCLLDDLWLRRDCENTLLARLEFLQKKFIEQIATEVSHP